MKKILFVIFSACLFFLLSLNVNASTLIDFKESSSGKIDTTLTFEEGFVGGIDIKVKVSGNVSLEDVVWDKGLSSKYTKKFSYKDGVINLIVTTGKNTNNLVDRNGLLKLGTLVFSGDDKFTLTLDKITIVDANYDSKVLSTLETSKNNSFSIENTSKEEDKKPEEDNKDDENTSSGGSSTSGNTSSTNTNTNSESNSSNVTSNGTTNNNSNQSSSLEEDFKDEDHTSDEENEVSNDKESNEKEDTKKVSKDETRIFFTVTFVLICMILVAAFIYARRCNKLKENN